MTAEYQDYSLFIRFFETFSKSRIEGIDPNDRIMIELDTMMEINHQFFYISDVILMEMQFISKGVYTLFGIEPEKVTAGYFITTTHPDDVRRHQLLRTKLIDTANDLYLKKNGTRIISSNFKGKKPDGSYIDRLFQAFFFYSMVPYKSVFLIMVITDISGFKHIHKGFHVYNGNDRKFFRFPDDELLMTGIMFSQTEFRIIELIDEGLSSMEIARKLFRSIHTINTHRTNIIEKSGKNSIADVIRDLKGQGLL